MDGIALASVITSGVVGLAGLGTGVWSTRHAAKVTRESRVEDRKIDAYLEILRLVEHKTLWFDTKVAIAELTGDPYAKMPALPHDPDVGEQATITALLAAFGSGPLVDSCTGWTEAAKEMDRLFEVAAWNYHENYYGPETPTKAEDLSELQTQLAVLIRERRSIESAISQEIQSVRHAG